MELSSQEGPYIRSMSVLVKQSSIAIRSTFHKKCLLTTIEGKGKDIGIYWYRKSPMEVKIHRKVDAPELEAEDNAGKTKGKNLTGKKRMLNSMTLKIFIDSYLVNIAICGSGSMSFNNFEWILHFISRCR